MGYVFVAGIVWLRLHEVTRPDEGMERIGWKEFALTVPSPSQTHILLAKYKRRYYLARDNETNKLPPRPFATAFTDVCAMRSWLECQPNYETEEAAIAAAFMIHG